MTLLFRTTQNVGRVVWRQTFRTATRPSAALIETDKPNRNHSSATLSSVAYPSLSSVASSTIDRVQLSSALNARYFSAQAVNPEIKLYQYNICPFCHITKSLISYSKLDYESVEVNPLTKAELKPWSGDYKKVPIALIDEEQANGSEEIVESILDSPRVQTILEQRWSEECSNDNGADGTNKMTMQQFQESENAKKWIHFARDDLAAILYPNICSSLSDSYDAFGYVKYVDSFSSVQKMSIQYLGALAMYFAASKIKSKRNITDERATLHEALDKVEREGLQDGKLDYLSGCQCPDMGDVAVFGVLNSVKGLDAHKDAIQTRGGEVKEWYDRMHEQVLGEEAKY
mmetsp:Transcript_25791/g.44024  ORF Transcript_25791/g.44024 Transcript_25791/m.44024 type:complete len:344 (-) Transcript_25791:812-1843(-)|eukprot:CAMPEP_0183739514 /NCGR_PEP_ID=MMETSP0737-20130205/57249_1 /TAXON_ID=385413 /ORGANISM="Thalassiosira miniscula, Strain CCMP1093" /LENGTH=343 /DNA_ID=CAMNT_0025974337 /DNA_START=68 /DNA_END=1099 /DNA_ORIENTATION=-